MRKSWRIPNHSLYTDLLTVINYRKKYGIRSKSYVKYVNAIDSWCLTLFVCVCVCCGLSWVGDWSDDGSVEQQSGINGGDAHGQVADEKEGVIMIVSNAVVSLYWLNMLMSAFFLGHSLYKEDFSVPYTLRSMVDTDRGVYTNAVLCGCSKNERGKNHIDGSQLRVCLSVLPRPKLFLVPIGFYRSYLMSLSLIICSLIRKWQPCRWYW